MGFDSQEGQRFPLHHSVKLALWLTQTTLQYIKRILLQGFTRPERDSNLSPPSTAEVNNA
jgi:hypothetical protein